MIHSIWKVVVPVEDFISDIYQHSFIISNLKEFIFLLNSGRKSQARSIYNDTALKLEKWLEEISSTDPLGASSVQDIAVKVKESYEDPCACKGLIEGQLIPALYNSIKSFNTIDVTEGKYNIKSSETAFLTIKDIESGLYLHDIHDPMDEAYHMVSTLYKPEMEGFLLLGCGLGYEAYQIYHQSDGAITIYLYEEDRTILDFAKLYGVLALIPDENLVVIHTPDCEELAKEFLNNFKSHPSFGYHVASFKKTIFNGVCDNELNRIIINHEFSFEAYHSSTINLWKNKHLKRIDFSRVALQYVFDECVLVSAGPSFDDNLEFIRTSKGNRCIVAVNTVLRRLVNENIVPDILVAADPSPSLMNHLEGLESNTEKITLIADWVLSWRYAYLYRGDICFVRTNASTNLTRDFLPHDPIWDISGTVACLGIETAIRLNCKKIYLVGQDLAYPSGQKYAKGMPHAEAPEANWQLQVPSVDGGMVDTCEAFNWFRKAIEYQIAKYDHVEFINMSKHGALINGTTGNLHIIDNLYNL